MSDRISSITVVLHDDLTEEHAKAIVDAISMIRGVGDVRANVAEPMEQHVARMRFGKEVAERLHAITIGALRGEF